MNSSENFIKNLNKRNGQQYDKENGAVYDDQPISIGKDTDGIEKTNHDLHAKILIIIKEIDRICRKNNISYALAFGSALGINNYKGFIPWDDDADIAMDYQDAYRFIEACKKDLSDDFYLNCYETDDKYNVLIPTMKIGLKNTYCQEITSFTLPNKCKNGDGIFVDIVIFMGVPENEKEHLKLLKYTKRKVIPYIFIDAFLRLNPKRLKNKIKDFEKRMYDKYQNSSHVAQTIIIPWQDLLYSKHLSYPREMIFPFREYEFEGEKFYSFNQLEAYCKYQYGDQSVKKWEDGKWIDPYPSFKRKMKHLINFNLDHKIKK